MTISKQQQYYQDLLQAASDTSTEASKSMEWLNQQTNRALSQMQPNTVINKGDDRLVRSVSVGHMYLFAYDAKTKNDLPYWDRFPLIFPFRRVRGGFYGINMHYLPPLLRAKLMDQLYSLATNTSYDDTTKLRLSYNILNSAARFRYFEPCVKHYLNKQVKSRFLWVPSASWDRVLFLPLERFVGATKQQVWADTNRKVRR